MGEDDPDERAVLAPPDRLPVFAARDVELRFVEVLLLLPAGRVVVLERKDEGDVVRAGVELRAVVVGRDEEERAGGALVSEKSLDSKKLMVVPRAASAEWRDC